MITMLKKAHDYFTLILVSARGGKLKEYHISRPAVILIFFLLALFIALLIYGAFSYGRVYVTALRVKMVERQNREYAEQNRKIKEAYANIKYILSQDKKLKMLLGENIKIAGDTEENYDSLLSVSSRIKDSLRIQSQYQNTLKVTKEMTDFIPNIMPVSGPISQGFSAQHRGIDIAAAEGTPVVSTADGVVVFSGQDLYYGNLIKIDHNDNYMTVYGHLQKNLVAQGDTVKRGQIIGYVGNTGRSTAPHLHYEIRQKGVPIDPRTMIFIK